MASHDVASNICAALDGGGHDCHFKHGEEEKQGCNAVPCDCVGEWQGLTLVHFSAHFEPCPTHKIPLHTLSTP